jgi:hypothetical protein
MFHQQEESQRQQYQAQVSPDHLLASQDEDSIFDNVAEDHSNRPLNEDKYANNDENGNGNQNFHALQSLLSDDDSVDTTATSSSIVTNSRVTSMDLDLRIQPSRDLHFWLSHNDETSRCTVTVSNMSMSYLPLAFKIQASERRRYMVWPSVGVVKPQSSMSITVFLLDEAKQELLDLFQKLGPAAEFRQTDTVLIEWCGVPSDFCSQLSGDHDQDFETLWSYWNICQKNEGWASEQSCLRVRISVDSKDWHHCQAISRPASSGSHHSRCEIPPRNAISMDATAETMQFLEAEIENLRRKCEELTAERYIVEQQLEEAREKLESSPPRGGGGAVHKFQLQQTMRCGYCLKVFRSDHSSLLAPISSQSCGHSICRNCCFRRSSSKRGRSEKHTLSSDLLMCVGDMHSMSVDDDSSCPICHAPSAFGSGKLNVNQSLCLVLRLLE